MFKTARLITLATLAFQFSALALRAQTDLSGATVTIPYSELRSLWEAAQQNDEAPAEPAPKPPIPALLRSATLSLYAGESHTTISANFEAINLSDEWQLVPLLGGDVQINTITPPDASVVHREGRFGLLLPPDTSSAMQLELTAPRINAKGIQLAPAPAVAGKLVFNAPEDSGMITIDGATATGPGGPFILPPEGGEITVRVAPAEALAATVDLPPSQWEVSGESSVAFEDAMLTFTARLHLHADDGAGDAAQIVLPGSARVLTLEGEDLDSWKATRTPNGKRAVEVRWANRQQLDRELDLSWQVPQPPLAKRWELAPPAAAATAAGGGAPFLFAVIETEGLEYRDAEGSLLADPTQLPGWLARKLAGAPYSTIRADAGSVALTPCWLPRLDTPEATISNATFEQNLVPGGALLTKAKITVDHRAATKWAISLPAGGDVLTCKVAGSPARPALREAGALEFALPAPGPETSATIIEFCYAMQLAPLDPVAGQLAIELPETGLFVNQLDWTLAIPASYEPVAAQGNVEILPGTDGMRFRKQLVRGDRPAIELYYRRKD